MGETPRQQEAAAEGPLIVFDGVCVLCSSFARLVARFDRQKLFRFATAQSPFGQSLYRRYHLRTDDYETNIVIIAGVAHQRLDSIIAVLDALGWPWRAARLLYLLPRPARNWLYSFLARNRDALFGKKESCEIPSGDLRDRLID
jgi:predicted DCC family thiol-disulfide oxidoreductase YuxK